MEQTSNYKKQAFFNTLGNFVYLFCTWVLTVLVVRLSGYDDAGVLSIAMSVGNIFFFIGMYGIRQFQSSDVTHKYSSRTYINVRIITVVGSIVMCLGYFGFMALIGRGYKLYTALSIFLYLLYRCFEAGSDVIFGELQKDGHLEVCGISMSVKGVLSVAVFYVLMKITNLPVALAGMTVIAAGIMLLYDVNRYKALHSEPDSSGGTVKNLLLEGLPMLVTTIIPIIITAMPRLALSKYCGEAQLGIYSSICTPTVIITTLVPNILTPFMTYYGELHKEKKHAKLFSVFWISVALTAALGLLACLAAWLLGDWALSLVYGNGVLPYMYIFIPIIAATVVYAFSMCGNSVLISIRAPKAFTAFTVAALAVCAAICDPLTEKFGMWGTVIAFGAPFAVQFILQVCYIVYALWFKPRRTE